MLSLRSCFLFLIGTLLLASSCTYENLEELYPPSAECVTENLSYVADIEPIIKANCATSGCHEGAFPSAGLALTTYQEVSDATLNGNVINRITRPEGDPALMPTSGKMSDCNIDKIVEWALQGAPEN
jgi:hypothetical protein